MSGDIAARLAPEVTTLALCWRIVRSDGVALGFTTHDQPLLIDGLLYAAAPGMAPSAVAVSDGLDVDTMEVAGALTADAITAADLEAGRFDAARVRLFMVDWTAPEAGQQPLAHGTLGEVTRKRTASGGSFNAALRGPTAAFEATAIHVYSPECRAELGDAKCRIDLAARTSMVTVAASDNPQAFAAAALGGDGARFVHGRCRALSGANAGIDARIAAVVADTVTLFEPLPFALLPGVRIELREGCDKRLATCASRFGNVVNFRGEPHVPGGDMLTRFPGV